MPDPVTATSRHGDLLSSGMPEGRLETGSVFVVTGNQIHETGSLTWDFMMKDDVPFDNFASFSDTFGFLRYKEDTWFINVMKAGEGQIFGGSSTDLAELMKASRGQCPSVVLLMSRKDYVQLEVAGKALNLTLDCYHGNGAISTS